MQRSIKHWRHYNQSIISIFDKNKTNSILISFEKLMTTDFEIQRLNKFLDIELNDSRNKSLWNNKPDSSIMYNIFSQYEAFKHGMSNQDIYEKLNQYRLI